MLMGSIHFRGDVCFKNEWAGFDAIQPLNVIIGKNNSGKSRLLDFIEAQCRADSQHQGWQIRRRCKLDEKSLASVFARTRHHGELYGDHWNDHGRLFVGVEVEWTFPEGGGEPDVAFLDHFDAPRRPVDAKAREDKITALLKAKAHELQGRAFRRLVADRDIRPEEPRLTLGLDPSGEGASNIIRRFILSSNNALPRELVQEELLDSLNRIIGRDGSFNEIQVQEHDEDAAGRAKDHWELYLGESRKGLVPLSSSGSGLKTLILVLLNLLVIPSVEERPKSDFVFAFEELENNLHPAVLRRLFLYLENFAVEHSAPIFLTTHSNVAVDFFGRSERAQIVHVSHDGESARTATVSGHFEFLRVFSDLGVRPSDLLQANGVVWLKGPSDRLYVNRWIDLMTAGSLREGRDYQCAFYGGSLLARNQFAVPEDADVGLANLFQVNPNVVVVCDSDKSSQSAGLKDRVKRIRDEVARIPTGHMWITNATEIENYLPGSVLAAALGRKKLPDPKQWERFYPRKRAKSSYWEREVGRNSADKVDLAAACAPHMTRKGMMERLDWRTQVTGVVERIRSWST